MLSSINISHIFVFDQQKALDCYVGKLGLEVSNDLDLGVMRWLTVRVAGDPSRDVLLEVPGPPGMDPKSAEQVRELISKGASGFAIGFTTKDARKTFDESSRQRAWRSWTSSPSANTGSTSGSAIRSPTSFGSCSSPPPRI